MLERPAPVIDAAARRARLAGVSVVLVAALARAFHLSQAVDTLHFATPVLDAQTNWEAALLWADGDGPARPFFKAPLYPWAVGQVIRLLRPILLNLSDVLGLVLILQHALGVLTAWLVWRLARAIAGEPAGLAAGLMCALAGSLLFFEGELLDASLTALLLTAGVTVLGTGRGLREWWRPLLSGALLGLATITRPTCVAPALALLGLLATRRWRADGPRAAALTSGLFAGPLLVLVLVVAAANGGRAVIATYGGPNFWLANHAGSDGWSTAVPQRHGAPQAGQDYIEVFALREGARRAGRDLAPEEADRFWRAEGLRFWREEPVRALWQTARRAVYFWQGPEIKSTKRIEFVAGQIPVLRLLHGLVAWRWVAPLGAVGLWLAVRRRWPGAGFVALGVVALFLASLPFPVNSRYRVPALPLLCAGAGMAIAALAADLRARRWQPALVALGWSLGLMFALRVDWARQPAQEWRDWWQLGNLAVERGNAGRGDLQTAEEAYRHALRLNPSHLESQVNLARLWLMQGRADAAVTQLRRTTAAAPDYPVGWSLYGQACLSAGHAASAEAALRRALELDPHHAAAGLALARLLLDTGRAADAMHLLESLAAAGVDEPALWALLGDLRAARGDAAGAGEARRRAARAR